MGVGQRRPKDRIADMISMRALECLVTVVEHGSLTQAAAVLHMSQPALSHQIAAIERELGTPVIERLPRGIRPTAAGLAATAEARIAVAAAERAVIVGRRVAAGAGGRIRIACAETMTTWVLVPVLRSWRRRYPDVELDLKEFTSANRMLDTLLAGQADITIGPRPTRTDEHTELLGCEEIVVVASPEHRFAGLGAVPLAELTNEPLVHYNPDNGFAVSLDQFAAERGVVLPQPALRTGFPRTAAQLAAAGMGVAVVPFSALIPPPTATIRAFDPPELRDIVVIVAAPHDDLLRRFVKDLKHRGLPVSRLSQLGHAQSTSSGAAGSTVMASDAYPVTANAGSAP
jgi:DNA-binding transcriptional LysR family regulator